MWLGQADQSLTIRKKNLIGLKLTEEEAAKLREYASKHDMTITQVLQKGIDLQYAMEETLSS